MMDKGDLYSVAGDVPGDRASALRVTVAGRFRSGPTYRTPPRVLEREHVLIFTEGGEGLVDVAGQRFVARKGDAFLLAPGIRHEYATHGESWDLLWFHCEGEIGQATEVAERSWIPPTPCGDGSAISVRIAAVIAELERKETQFERVAGAHAELAVAELMRRWGASGGDGPTHRSALSLVEAVSTHIRENIGEELEVGALGERFHVSARHLERLFKQHVGQTPKQYILRMKLSESKRLLYATDLTVADVAERVGFGDPYYFSRLFKSKSGESPSEFRRTRLSGLTLGERETPALGE